MRLLLYVGAAGWIEKTDPWIVHTVLSIAFVYMLFFLRELREKFGYNISHSSMFGIGLGASAVIKMGFQIIRQDPAIAFFTLTDVTVQSIVGLMSLLVGCLIFLSVASPAFSQKRKKQTAADTYHWILLTPILLFCLSLAVPAICIKGTSGQQWFAVMVGIVWLVLILVDRKTGRYDQPNWFLTKFGINVRKKT